MTEQRLCAVDGCGHPMPTGDNSTACPTCWNRHERTVAEIPALVDDLNTAIARQARIALDSGHTQRPTDDDEPDDIDPKRDLPGLRALRAPAAAVTVARRPVPYGVAASDALGRLHATMWPWVREALEAHPTTYLPDPSTIGLSRALLGLHGWLQGHPDGAGAIDAVAYAVAKCRASIDLGPDRWYCGVCSHDEDGAICTEELYAAAGRDAVTCRVCGTTHDVADRRTAMLDAAEDTLLTLSEMTRALALTGAQTVTRKQLEGWVRRGRLVRSGNAGPVALYRVSDVRDILAAAVRTSG